MIHIPLRCAVWQLALCSVDLAVPVYSLGLARAADSGSLSATTHNVREQRTMFDSSKRRLRFTSHWVAIPEAKFAFCFIFKVASYEFARVFNEANGILEGDHKDSMVENLNLDWSNVTRENGWKFAFFTRDPLERYLSAFKSKCIYDPNWPGGARLDMCGGPMVIKSAPLEKQIAAFENHVLNIWAYFFNQKDEHWQSQYSQLKAFGALERADFHDDLSGDVNRKVKAMLTEAHVKDASLLADHWFNTSSRMGETTNAHEDMSKWYRNEAVFNKVMERYAEDYEYLHLPKPTYQSVLAGGTNK